MEEKKRWRPTVSAYRKLEKDFESFKSDVSVLKSSNRLLEDEIVRLREEKKSYHKKIEELDGELSRLKNRSLWERIMNKT